MRVPRRRLLQIGTVGATGLSLPVWLQATQAAATPSRAKACLLLYMDGGPSHIDLFDLKPHAPREIRGPYRPIETSLPGLQLCEHLPRMARQMHRVTLVRSMCHEQTVHDPAVYHMLTGYPHVSTAGGLKVEPDDVPQMACSFARAARQRTELPLAIELPETMHMDGRILPGQNGGFLGPSWDPFRVSVSPEGLVKPPEFRLAADVTPQRLQRRTQLLDSLAGTTSGEVRQPGDRFHVFQQQALDILRSPQLAEAFDLSRESPAQHAAYGRHRHGQSVLLARRLIEAGARFVTVYWGREPQDWADGKGPRPANNPWDTHRNHFPLTSDSLLPRADQTFAALLEDLAQRGLLDETLVVWMGDFGRTPRISQPWASRDHWPHAFSLMLAGAGLTGGRIIGSTDAQAAYVTDGPISPGDLTATIFELLGVDPGTVIQDPQGRPHKLSPGRPVRELLG